MEELVGKRVRVHYVDDVDVDFEGTVQKVKDNLIFLVEVRMRTSSWPSWRDTEDQVVNTASSAFVRFDILN